jgi:F420-dependent oxidoreductase-like protein
MKLSMNVTRQPGAEAAADWAQRMEAAGIDTLWIGEAYGFDAVSMLGYLAGHTNRVQLGAAILPVFSRSPALVAMTAAGLDFVSSGRFLLGLGASGPQVVTDWHGVPFDRPLVRTRETIEVCRTVWSRQRLEYQGETFRVPLRGASGEGGGRSLKLMDHPLRAEIPIYVAALGPKNVALAAEVAEGWIPLFFHPDNASVWAEALADGARRRDAGLPRLEIVAGGPVAICDAYEASRIRDAMRPRVALYVGGMGPPGQNFYNDLFVRYGYEAEATAIQKLYLSGAKKEAASLVPEDFLRATSMVGDEGHVRERIEAFRAAGVTCLNVEFPGSHAEPAVVERIREWASD